MVSNLFGWQNPWINIDGETFPFRRLGLETFPKDKYFWASAADLHRAARIGLRNSLELAPKQAFFGAGFPVASFFVRILLYRGEL
jgi:hypothetical protein